MPFLDELSRKLRAHIPEFLGGSPSGLGGYDYGAAQSRLSHGPMQAIPDDQWQQFRVAHGQPNAYGFSQAASPILDPNNLTVYAPRHQFLNPPGPNAAPGAGTPRHEAIHQITTPVENKLDVSKVLALIGGDEGMRRFQSTYPGYSSRADVASEIPSRLTTDPGSLGLTPEIGQERQRQYIDLLRQASASAAARLSKDPSLANPQLRAAQLTKHPQLVDPAQRNTDVNQQQPSNFF